MAYLGYLYAFAGHPDVLTSEMLRDPELADKATRLLGEVDRTAGASGFLRDLFVENYADYDGMVNNESAIITANQQLIERGESDLLYVIYPVDGLAIADWPLGYVDHGDEKKSETFDKLQAFLQSEEAQAELVAQGRRTTTMGPSMDPADVDPTVFNPDWGIDVTRTLDPITLPAADVILEALDLYQTEFRKPSFVVFCLDFSGSMSSEGEKDLESAMQVLLDQQQATTYFLQRTGRDTTIVMPFSNGVKWEERVEGDDPAALQSLLARIQETEAEGGTNIYDCLTDAVMQLSTAPEGSAPAIVLMTDGRSNKGDFSDFAAILPEATSEIVPVYSIQFGDASKEELERIAEATNGAIYDGRDGLIQAMRDAFANA
jgi:Ca-activated chloride channel family protein